MNCIKRRALKVLYGVDFARSLETAIQPVLWEGCIIFIKASGCLIIALALWIEISLSLSLQPAGMFEVEKLKFIPQPAPNTNPNNPAA